MNKRLAVITYGCQMNERDSEEILGMLGAHGYAITDQVEGADVILLNTCSVREHAEERAYGKMGELSGLKRERPDLVLGIIGCMAKLHQESIFKRLPAVDLVTGPAELYDLPYLLAEIQEKRQRLAYSVERIADRKAEDQLYAKRYPLSAKVVAVGRKFRPLDAKPNGDPSTRAMASGHGLAQDSAPQTEPAKLHYRKSKVAAFVTIMEGCDKACTYCIVPMTRGQEISRPAKDILEEIRRLGESGYREVVLLGQNVNSYGKRFPDGSGFKGPLGRLRLLEEGPDALLDFPVLLRRIDASIQVARMRIRFTTSHPFDANERLFEAMRDCESVCESLHLPVQSGSTRMLRAMRRGYTREAYLDKIALLRRLMPEITLSTDIIVGFPGETDDDFEQTVSLLREVEYENVYIFKYSPRPGTDAAAREDDVPSDVKDTRHQRVLALKDEISLKRHRRLEGRSVEILVEGPGRQPGQLFGRTRGNHGVIVEGPMDLIGQLLDITITRATAHTLFGRLMNAAMYDCKT